jgi:hypothetical protein
VINKSLLALPEARRVRDKVHLKSVAKQPCLICGRQPADAHHLRYAQHPALGRKVSDEFTVPLCRGHHREVHRCGDETAWWRRFEIDPILTARLLWLENHPMRPGQERPASIEQLALEPNSPALPHPSGVLVRYGSVRAAGGTYLNQSTFKPLSNLCGPVPLDYSGAAYPLDRLLGEKTVVSSRMAAKERGVLIT